MNLSGLGDIADVLGALGVIASLIFVALEVRKNTKESRQRNWDTTIDRFAAVWGLSSDNPVLAELIERGRRSYESLSAAERLMFGPHHLQLCVAFEAMILHGRNQAQGDALDGQAHHALKYYFGFPGTRAWWADSSKMVRLSPLMMAAIDKAIADGELLLEPGAV